MGNDEKELVEHWRIVAASWEDAAKHQQSPANRDDALAEAEWAKLTASTIERLSAIEQERDEALRYATNFLRLYVHENCSPVAEWKPLPDLLGVLTQIDNATTITRRFKQERDALREAVWPDFIAPPKYPNPAPGWTDPRLPDFRVVWQIARTHGWAVGLHGSMKRDCDMIAVPWTETAAPPDQLIAALCSGLNAHEHQNREQKPHGRFGTILQIDGYVKHIDLSIIDPRRRALNQTRSDASEATDGH